MSLYNMIHGVGGTAPLVFGMLNADGPVNFGRTRDAWIEEAEDGSIRLAVYTRNGGGNREHYDNTDDSSNRDGGPHCSCTGCIITHHLPAHPLYIEDCDDDFDCTYATVYFRVPDAFKEHVAELAEVAVDKPDMGERWQAALDAIAGAVKK